jgi:hypothetical protein
MDVGLAEVKETLVQRLEAQGVEKCLIPGLLKLMASAFLGLPHINRQSVHRHMQFLGWNDFDLDEHTFQLAKACFESSGMGSKRRLPDKWFKTHFAAADCG